MNDAGHNHGFVVRCARTGVVQEVLQTSDDDSIAIRVGDAWDEIVDRDSRDKASRFFTTVLERGTAFNDELNVETPNGPVTHRFSAIVTEEGILIIAARTHNGMTNLVREFARIGNEQANLLRAAMKHSHELEARQSRDLEMYDEISRLNNDLVNLQRTVSKQNGELIRLNSLKNRFLGIAAHDLRNPLGNVAILSEFVEEDSHGLSENQGKTIEQIKALAGSMLDMVNDLLDVSAIESGTISLKANRTNLVELVRENAATNHHLAARRQIELSTDVPMCEVVAVVDTAKIHQVLNNLITNAIKYSPDRTMVSVRLTMSGSDAVISVTDQGPGIPAERQANLFQPFETAGTPAADGQKSTGLGLYICRRIVEAHGGRITVDSESDAGSTFAFTVPAEAR